MQKVAELLKIGLQTIFCGHPTKLPVWCCATNRHVTSEIGQTKPLLSCLCMFQVIKILLMCSGCVPVLLSCCMVEFAL